MDKLVLNSKEMCELCGLNKNDLTLYRRIGLLRGIKKGKKYLYPVVEVNRFLSECLSMDLTNEYTIQATKK